MICMGEYNFNMVNCLLEIHTRKQASYTRFFITVEGKYSRDHVGQIQYVMQQHLKVRIMNKQ